MDEELEYWSKGKGSGQGLAWCTFFWLARAGSEQGGCPPLYTLPPTLGPIRGGPTRNGRRTVGGTASFLAANPPSRVGLRTPIVFGLHS